MVGRDESLAKDVHNNMICDLWLSQILKQEVYKLVIDDEFVKHINNHTSQEYRILHALPLKRVFIYCKVPVDAISSIKLLEELDFYLIDTNMTFEKPILPTHHFAGYWTIRFAVPSDESQVVELARKNFAYSRFHLDGNISRDAANTVKAEWVRNYFLGNRGEQMVVATVEGRVVGFIQVLYGNEKTLIIDLIAVDKKWRRKGIAVDMIAYAESNCGGFNRIQVGSQIANIPSIRLYEKLGFKMFKAEYVFHYHAG